MNHKKFWVVSIFVLSGMLLLSSGYVQAQTVTAGKIVKWFDEFGTQTDSVITENDMGNIGIGGPPSADVAFPLTLSRFLNGSRLLMTIENTGPFSAAVLRLKTPAAGSDWCLIAAETGAGTARLFSIDQNTAGGAGRLAILADSGNVGIGTQLPTAKLHVIGNFIATGTKSALVETASYGKRQLYAMESPENWFEDFGRAKVINGQAVVKLDPMFAETVNTESEYHVFLTPGGDCNGLYVANRTAASFEVRELQNGKGTIVFDYRIVAKRKGYERARLAKGEEARQETEIAQVAK